MVFFFQNVLPFVKIISFATLLICLPQICFLSLQLRFSEAKQVCYNPDDCTTSDSVIDDVQWSDDTKDLGKTAYGWTLGNTLATSLNCLLAVVSLVSISCKERADAIKSANMLVSVQDVISQAMQAR